MPKCSRTIGVMLVLGLLVTAPICLAGDTDRKDAGAAKTTASQPTGTQPATKAVEKPRDKAPSNEETLAAIEQLKTMLAEQSQKLEAQQQKIQTLELKLAEKETASPSTSVEANRTSTGTVAVSVPAPPQDGELKKLDDRLTGVETDFGAYKKANDGKVRRFGPFSFSGDARVRFEPFHGGGNPASTTQARNRYRVRLRFNATAKFSDQISGGFSLGSGDTNDPISTNQTLGAGFTRKPFFIDRAFVKYDPKWARPLSFTAGKQAYPWYRTELTWDGDLNPEGLSETLSWNFKDSPVTRIALVAFQGPVVEISSGKDTFLYVGQFQSNFKLGSFVKLGTYIGYYNFQNSDPLRAARAAGSIGGSSNSNSASTTGTQYNSKFGLFDATARLDFKTPSARWPVAMIFDYVRNTRACDNRANIPLANQTACNSRDNQGYWGEIQFGRTSEAGDVNIGYTLIHIEKEATLDAFNFSDLRVPTGVVNHRVNFGYQAYRNVTLGFTGLFGRPLVVGSATTENILKRMQFDVIYKF
ncbi:MAG: putative porin [Acidobacteria bacterium]|nr:putative porin [Acidobacteriota bacterium]